MGQSVIKPEADFEVVAVFALNIAAILSQLRGILVDQQVEDQLSERRLLCLFGAVAVVLATAGGLLQWSPWIGSRLLHTVMEVAGTTIAMIVGLAAFMRYYSRKNNTHLFIATGFVGTALLDGYHAVVTSDLLSYVMPSPPPSLIPWSWNASRTFLSVLMVLSWWTW